MSYPIPPEGHAVVIVNHGGVLYAADLVAHRLDWRARSPFGGEYDVMHGFLRPPYQRGDFLSVEGTIVSMAIYDPTTGQTEPETQPALPPARPELES